MGRTALARIEQGRHGCYTRQQFFTPRLQADLGAVAAQGQAWRAAFLDGAREVIRVAGTLLGGDRRALVERAEQQKGVEEAARFQTDADRLEWVDIHAAHFDVLHAAQAQRLDRALARAYH